MSDLHLSDALALLDVTLPRMTMLLAGAGALAGCTIAFDWPAASGQ